MLQVIQTGLSPTRVSVHRCSLRVLVSTSRTEGEEEEVLVQDSLEDQVTHKHKHNPLKLWVSQIQILAPIKVPEVMYLFTRFLSHLRYIPII